MKYTFILSFFILSIIMGGTWVFYQTHHSQDTHPIKDSYIKNSKWGTQLQTNMPYSIGNSLEFYYILDPNTSEGRAKVNLEKLSEKIDITNIEFWEKQIDVDTNINFNLKKNTPLKISWVAKVNNNSNDSDTSDLLDIEIIPNTIAEEIAISPEATETLKIPTNIWISETIFQSNLNNLLEISGDNIENILYVTIGWNSFVPTFKNGKMYVFIEKAIFQTGNYFILLQTKNNKIITLEKNISFFYVDADVSVTHITPNIVSNRKNSWIVLQGDWFNKIISIQLNNNLILKDTAFEVISNWVLQLQIPKSLAPGRYNINVLTTQDIINIDTIFFTVTS